MAVASGGTKSHPSLLSLNLMWQHQTAMRQIQAAR